MTKFLILLTFFFVSITLHNQVPFSNPCYSFKTLSVKLYTKGGFKEGDSATKRKIGVNSQGISTNTSDSARNEYGNANQVEGDSVGTRRTESVDPIGDPVRDKDVTHRKQRIDRSVKNDDARVPKELWLHHMKDQYFVINSKG
mmetsp:Transcript_35342/g.40305  ORF Transcript_35342/g.40305 Transcript_35342/m.40305 type:complete len:143 (+) Transcript_35342:210-638(+)